MIREPKTMKRLFFLPVVVALGGCGAAEQSTADSTEQTFTVTSVHTNADGTTDVTYSTITLEQELAENAARAKQFEVNADGLGTAAEAIMVDGTCASQSLWVFDQTDGGGNRLCLDGPGAADLASFCRLRFRNVCFFDWSMAVRSYWPGTEDGFFSDGHFFEVFSANQPLTNAGFAQQSTSVSLID
jgi:hypothetical protein